MGNKTLFLDRDGVINQKLEDDYVKTWDEFRFCKNALKAIAELSQIFNMIFIVTNQRGVGKGIMSERALMEIHKKMIKEIENASGKISKVYYCTDVDDTSHYRKPRIGMGLQAKQEFPEIEFSDSFMVGDSISDMEFARRLGMQRVLISQKNNTEFKIQKTDFDLKFDSLYAFAEKVKYGILD